MPKKPIAKNTQRRKALKTLGAGAVGAVGVACASALPLPAYAKGIRTLKLVTTWPKNLPGIGNTPEIIAKNIEDMSDGQLRIKVFAAGELVPAFEAFDAVATGTAEMYHGAEYYWQGKSAAFNFFTTVPFGMLPQELAAWIHFGGGQELWEELSAKFNIRPFLAGNTGLQMGGWFNREINSVDDFRGLKMRMPGLGGEVIRRLGAVAVALPGGEIFPAMKSGAIDASEWNGPWNDTVFGFHQVAEYYYCPGFHEPGAGLSLGVNQDVYNDLTTAQKTMIRVAAHAENDRTLAAYNYENARSYQTLIHKHKVKIRTYPDDVVLALREKSQDVLAEVAAKDELTTKIYKSFKAFQDISLQWRSSADDIYNQWRIKT
ncbi:MAG: TRAP transporter substrate-binding protein [Alphaproteobacteria bacterium]|nr:TRAP transporter substrate-binding protein [Alphaproteobacteria bacterium]MBE8220882.1 TRAP transporter substrate-binding protein [Alphaproteobacteria bacterium]